MQEHSGLGKWLQKNTPAIGNLQPAVPQAATLGNRFVTSNHPAGAVPERQGMGRERKQFKHGFYLPQKEEISKSQLTDEEKVLNHLEQAGWLTKTGLSHFCQLLCSN